MPRVIGIDPGTVSIDLCGLEDGKVFLDRSIPTPEVATEPARLVDVLRAAGELDLIAGPSGYGLPLIPAGQATDNDLRLAFLAAPREDGGIPGMRALARALVESNLPVVFTPGVIHLPSVPEHRKINRVDMGTADKVAATVLAIDEQGKRMGRAPSEVSLVLLELGGAFTAAVAVAEGRIVDGVGGTGGPLGYRSPGALDAEVAFLAGPISKQLLFDGGAARAAQALGEDVAREALIEQACKAVTAVAMSIPELPEVVLSGRLARDPAIRDRIGRGLTRVAPVRLLRGFAHEAKEGAQGAALMADGLAGGSRRELVERLGLRAARGTVLDHLFVISAASARQRLGLA